MFQDALVESSGKLRSRSRRWLPVTLLFNLTIVVCVMLVPLLHPAALPRAAFAVALIAPPAPVAAVVRTQPKPAHATRTATPLNAMIAPSRVPTRIETGRDLPQEAVPADATGNMIASGGHDTMGIASALALAAPPVVVAARPDQPKAHARLAVSSGVAAGALLARTTPVYPAIAKAARVSGTVLLHAVISKAGSIESLQVLAGPELLRASALDAVRQWRYRPYLLNSAPTEVETTITVVFSLGG